ncbi:MAG: hypothetical protein QNJ54_26100 [Prochloraceae cyanobacterium]|nr:hypothetical protein [Prochloraceae cyanobacterium]
MSFHKSIPQTYEISVKGHLPEDWEDWFEGMKIQTHPQRSESILKGSVVDQCDYFLMTAAIRYGANVLQNINRLDTIFC